MAVPEYRHLMLPLLRLAGDGKEHRVGEALAAVAAELQLTNDDLNELLPSGTQRKFFNRIHWAATYSRKAGLLESTGRATFRITERWRLVLQKPPPTITPRFLRQFPEFVQFQRTVHSPGSVADSAGEESNQEVQTPQEILDASYRSLRQALGSDLPEQSGTLARPRLTCYALRSSHPCRKLVPGARRKVFR